MAAYLAHFDRPATLALVHQGEAADVPGVEVRERKAGELVVGKGCVAVGER